MNRIQKLAIKLSKKYANILPPPEENEYYSSLLSDIKPEKSVDWNDKIQQMEIANAKIILNRETHDKRINHLKRLFDRATTLKENFDFNGAKYVYDDIIFLCNEYSNYSDPNVEKLLKRFCEGCRLTALSEIKNIEDRHAGSETPTIPPPRKI